MCAPPSSARLVEESILYFVSKNTVMRMILCLAGKCVNDALFIYTDIRALLQANTKQRVRRHAQIASRVSNLPSRILILILGVFAHFPLYKMCYLK